MIRFRQDGKPVPVDSYSHSTRTWTLWTHTWKPKAKGRYEIALSVDDPEVRTVRLDWGLYTRAVDIETV